MYYYMLYLVINVLSNLSVIWNVSHVRILYYRVAVGMGTRDLYH